MGKSYDMHVSWLICTMSQNDEISNENNHFVNQDILSLMSYWKN